MIRQPFGTGIHPGPGEPGNQNYDVRFLSRHLIPQEKEADGIKLPARQAATHTNAATAPPPRGSSEAVTDKTASNGDTRA